MRLQRIGKTKEFIDTEGKFDVKWHGASSARTFKCEIIRNDQVMMFLIEELSGGPVEVSMIGKRYEVDEELRAILREFVDLGGVDKLVDGRLGG